MEEPGSGTCSSSVRLCRERDESAILLPSSLGLIGAEKGSSDWDRDGGIGALERIRGGKESSCRSAEGRAYE